MANISIPESVRPGLKKIALLSQNELEDLFDVLRKAPKNELFYSIEQDLKDSGLQEETAVEISKTIQSVGYLIASNRNINNNLAKDLVEAFFEDLDKEDAKIVLENVLLERLNDILLLSDYLIAGNEGVRIVWDNNKVLNWCNISTETVILNDRNYQTPAPGILINRLAIRYRENEKMKDISFALDRTDMLLLKSLIDNALKENSEIKSQYNKFIKFLEF